MMPGFENLRRYTAVVNSYKLSDDSSENLLVKNIPKTTTCSINHQFKVITENSLKIFEIFKDHFIASLKVNFWISLDSDKKLYTFEQREFFNNIRSLNIQSLTLSVVGVTDRLESLSWRFDDFYRTSWKDDSGKVLIN